MTKTQCPYCGADTLMTKVIREDTVDTIVEWHKCLKCPGAVTLMYAAHLPSATPTPEPSA